MTKQSKKIVAGAIGAFIIALLFWQGRAILTMHPQEKLLQKEVVTKTNTYRFSYKGENGRNALQLLKEKVLIQQDSTGLVTSINGHKLKPEKREYWAFYVNGTFSKVGPAEYMTNDGDLIEWRVEKY